ncbi:MAG: S1 family peptidase [Actinomycetota bacterium]
MGVEFMRRSLLLVALAAALSLSVVPSGAVVGGQNASPGEYPWMAAIYTGSPAGGQYCGGSLVAPRYVVTAAHCVQELIENAVASLPIDPLGLKVKVMLGRTALDGDGGEEIVVRSLHAHPDANVDTAVLELTTASAQTPIAWARPGQEAYFAAGVVSTVTGWGLTSENGSPSNTLKEAQVPMISDAQCAAHYGNRFNPPTEVCAGYPQGGADTCQGDSGGPLMVPGPGGAFLLAGLTSWGDGCARPGVPGVYAQVTAASAFIDQYA